MRSIRMSNHRILLTNVTHNKTPTNNNQRMTNLTQSDGIYKQAINQYQSIQINTTTIHTITLAIVLCIDLRLIHTNIISIDLCTYTTVL